MLDVDGGPDIDAGFQHVFHVLPALGVAQAGGVGVRQLVDEQQTGAAGEGGVEVEFLEHLAAIGNLQARQHLDVADFREGAAAPMRFDQPGDDVDPGLMLGIGRNQHFPGLADAGGGAKEDFQMPALAALRMGEQGIGVRPGVSR